MGLTPEQQVEIQQRLAQAAATTKSNGDGSSNRETRQHILDDTNYTKQYVQDQNEILQMGGHKRVEEQELSSNVTGTCMTNEEIPSVSEFAGATPQTHDRFFKDSTIPATLTSTVMKHAALDEQRSSSSPRGSGQLHILQEDRTVVTMRNRDGSSSTIRNQRSVMKVQSQTSMRSQRTASNYSGGSMRIQEMQLLMETKRIEENAKIERLHIEDKTREREESNRKERYLRGTSSPEGCL